jgi:hypothetical protein
MSHTLQNSQSNATPCRKLQFLVPVFIDTIFFGILLGDSSPSATFAAPSRPFLRPMLDTQLGNLCFPRFNDLCSNARVFVLKLCTVNVFVRVEES